MANFKTGFGYDAHRFESGRKLILCGVEIPYAKGLAGHSDADAPLHALTDALLGALALGDIGKLFPDTDDAFLNADSLDLLKRAFAQEAFREWSVSSADITIVAQAPKIAPHTEAMRRNIAEALRTDLSNISVKGKTTEGMGFCGRLEGIEAFASVLLERKSGDGK